MNRTFLLLSLLYIVSSCSNNDEPFVYGYQMDRLGRDKTAPVLSDRYTKHSYQNASLELLQIPIPSQSLKKGLKHQLKLLQNFSNSQVNPNDILNFDTTVLKNTVHQLLQWSNSDSVNFLEQFDLYKLNGRDKKGSVLFTGYYTPIHTLHYQQDTLYKNPVFYTPLGSQSELMKDTIEPKLAWAKQKTAGAIRLQGSGIIKVGGKQQLLSYHPKLTSKLKLPLNDSIDIQRHLFFSQKGVPTGAGLVPLTNVHTIAVDPKYIPLGSCLLAAVPILNERGHFIRHEFRILVAQDKGGSVKRMHVDLYFGVGQKAYTKASLMRHYGRLWLIEGKSNLE